MALNPLAPVVDYQSMLGRICCCSAAATVGATWLLRQLLPGVDAALERVDVSWRLGAGAFIPIPGGYLLPALAVGLVSRVFRVHSRLGSWLGIRERFEIEVILPELAQRVGVDVGEIAEAEWLARRRELMRGAFYRFTGGRASQIDEHLVHQALDLWSWFWVGLETALLLVLAGLALVAGGQFVAGLAVMFGAASTAGLMLPEIRDQCRHYAIAQVQAIVSDPVRAAAVQEAFAWAPRGRQAA